jgi:hypothetical protein
MVLSLAASLLVAGGTSREAPLGASQLAPFPMVASPGVQPQLASPAAAAASPLSAREPLAVASHPARTPSTVPEVTVRVDPETEAGFPYDDAFEPIVATDPLDPDAVAVVYASYRSGPMPCDRPNLVSVVRVSHDKGRTWTTAKSDPWSGSGRRPNWHAAIAWGPGPVAGTSRLYWVDTTVSRCDFGDHRLSLAWTDDDGITWSKMRVEKSTPTTSLGGYPAVAVDRNLQSPDRGTVYVVYNWFRDGTAETQVAVLASSDFGNTWEHAGIAPLRTVDGKHPYRWRIGFGVVALPRGGAAVSFCQVDASDPDRAAVGRIAFGITMLSVDAKTGAITVGRSRLARTVHVNAFTIGTSAVPGSHDDDRLQPCWSHGLEVDRATGDVVLAIADYDSTAANGRASIQVGASPDGQTWSWTTVPRLALPDGRSSLPHWPTLAASGTALFLGFHLLAPTKPPTVWDAWALSSDGGATWSDPTIIGTSGWDVDAVDHARNGAGLRDQAQATVDGLFVYAYAKGSNHSPRSTSSRVFVSVIEPDR